MKTIIIWTAAFVTLAALAFAAAPQTINYQGYLKDTTTSVPVSGNVNMTFRLYSTETPLNPLWSGVPQAVPVSNGVYNTQIGPVALPFDRQYWLGVEVAGSELLPLQQLHSVPYALNAPLQTSTSITSSGSVFEITNTGSGAAIAGFDAFGNSGTLGNGLSDAGVTGFSSGSGTAIKGMTTDTNSAGSFAIFNPGSEASSLFTQTNGTGKALEAIASGNGLAIYGSAHGSRTCYLGI